MLVLTAGDAPGTLSLGHLRTCPFAAEGALIGHPAIFIPPCPPFRLPWNIFRYKFVPGACSDTNNPFLRYVRSGTSWNESPDELGERVECEWMDELTGLNFSSVERIFTRSLLTLEKNSMKTKIFKGFIKDRISTLTGHFLWNLSAWSAVYNDGVLREIRN